jgi:hypothetical protein
MTVMRKFTEKKEQKEKKDDLSLVDKEITRAAEDTKDNDEWVIDSIIDVSRNEPLTESIIINAELGDKNVKRGDEIYITAMIHKRANEPYHHQQMGVLKARITDIYHNLHILNTIRR